MLREDSENKIFSILSLNIKVDFRILPHYLPLVSQVKTKCANAKGIVSCIKVQNSG